MYEITSPHILTMVGVMMPPFLVGVGAIVGGNYLCAQNGFLPLLVGFLIKVIGGLITLFTGWPIILLLTVMAIGDSSWSDRTSALVTISTFMVSFAMVCLCLTWTENLFATGN